MKKLKFVLILFIVLIVIGLVEKWYDMVLLGRYWEYSSFLTCGFSLVIIPIFFLMFICLLINKILKF